MHLQQNDPEHSRHVKNLFLCLHSSFFPNTWVYESRVGSGAKDGLFESIPFLYYLTYNLFLKLLGVPGDGVIQNLTESVGAPLQDAVPYPLEYGERLGEPLAVSVNPNDNEFLWSWLNSPFGAGGFVLHEIALLQVGNLELKLNLWPIVFRNLCLNLATHRTLDFNQNPIFSDTVWGCAEPGVLAVLDKTNLVGLSVVFCVIQVPDKGFETRPMFCGGVSGPLGSQNLLFDKCIF